MTKAAAQIVTPNERFRSSGTRTADHVVAGSLALSPATLSHPEKPGAFA
jgi:hypothetical protein